MMKCNINFINSTEQPRKKDTVQTRLCQVEFFDNDEVTHELSYLSDNTFEQTEDKDLEYWTHENEQLKKKICQQIENENESTVSLIHLYTVD